ncbi:MAG: tetratricopeptide repeat protein [Pirellulaceae bacterium]
MWDLVCLVATPAAIFPALWLIARYVTTPEQVYLWAFAFASFGHHLPGFLRAYGDRQLFARYRWRFLLAPPLICAVVLLFTWRDLHGFILIMFVWATWHVLMQTYGFLRIYDVKRGTHGRWSARLDYLACLAIFAVGIVFSEARVVGIADDLWQTGLPVFGPRQLLVAKWLVGVGSIGLLCGYVAFALHCWRSGRGFSWQKIALLLSTGALYWASGLVSTNVLVGVAMFDVFHAVQYFAIVWVYNRRVVDSSAERMPGVGLLFHGRLWSLGLYAAAIAIYGAGFFVLRSIDSLPVQQAAVVLFTTSACLHFYYDGFIWRISRRETRSDLQLATDSTISESPPESAFQNPLGGRPRWVGAIASHHGWKWAALAVVGGVLVVVETTQGQGDKTDADRQLANTAAMAPNMAEVQSQLCRAALDRGDTDEALAIAQKEVALRPTSHTAREDLGAALQQAGRNADAVAALRIAVRLAPNRWQTHFGLGQALLGSEDWSGAERSYQKAARLAPENARIQQQMAESIIGAMRFEDALPVLRRAVQLDEQSAQSHYLLGVAQMQTEHYGQARESFQTALALAPRHTRAHFQLGNLDYLSGDYDAAKNSFRQCVEIDPDFCDAYNNLGAVLALEQRWEEAAANYRQAIALRPQDANANYNLGLLLLQDGDMTAARSYVLRAAELGRPVDPNVAADLGLEFTSFD